MSFDFFSWSISRFITGKIKTADGDLQMLTSQEPGTAFAFALKIVEILLESSDVKKIREAICL